MLRKVLVVDRDDADRALVGEMLRGSFEVIEAADPREANRLTGDNFKRLSAALICMGSQEDGLLTVISHLRASSAASTIPVIASASGPGDDLVANALFLGANDFIERPFKRQILVQKLRNIIQLREMAALANEFDRSKRTEEWLDSVLGSVDTAVIATVPGEYAPKMILSNDRYFDMQGLSREEYEHRFGKTLGAISQKDEERVLRAYRHIENTGEPVTLEYRIDRVSGGELWVREKLTARHISGHSEDVTIGVIRDVTRERELEHRLRLAEEELSALREGTDRE